MNTLRLFRPRLGGMAWRLFPAVTVVIPFALYAGKLTNSDATAMPPPDRARLVEAYGHIPLSFERNRGQTDRSVDFLARGSGYALFLKPTEATLVMRDEAGAARETKRTSHASKETSSKQTAIQKSQVVRMRLLAANSEASAEGVEQLAGKANYLLGTDQEKWQTNISTYGRVRYREVYPGVDLEYYGNGQQLEYDIRVAPKANYQQVRLEFAGADSLKVDTSTGDLLIGTGNRMIRQHKPVIYQEVAGTRRAVDGRYVLHAGRQVGFELNQYDRELPLVIDPVLAYSTYLGGSGDDEPFDMAVDSAGNAYIAGLTDSIDFPTAGPIQGSFSGGRRDVFVTKINPSGSALVFSTYLGGSDEDGAEAIAIDSSGNAYITGETASTNFPTVNALQATKSVGIDAFVAKLNSAGSALVYSTYLGGNGTEEGEGIAVDSTGNAYVVGETQSTNFPTVNPIQNGYGGIEDIFVSKINAAGSALIYSTYLGGAGQDDGREIAIDSAGNAYVLGLSDSNNFPTVNAFQSSYHGQFDVVLSKINAAGSALIYSTYLGGSGDEISNGLAIDSAGNAYVCGSTDSVNFPTLNPLQATNHGSDDVFVSKINPAGNALVYSTYLGGSNADDAVGLALDSDGNIYLTGLTSSTDFPTANALQATSGGGAFDAFVTKINANGSALVYSTYLGGNGSDFGVSIALDSAGNAFVTGSTTSSNFPTVGALQGTFHGGAYDAFVAKISEGPASPTVPLFNISTRIGVKTGDNVLIGGVVIQGAEAKSVLFRALGPTLGRPPFNVTGALADTTLELHQANSLGQDVILATNDNWQDTQAAAISATGLQPPDSLESAILASLSPGNYTVIVRGKNDTTGVGLLEAYDTSPGSNSQFANISSRGFVNTGDDVMIGGFVVGQTSTFLVRGLGPTLGVPPFNVAGALADPTLELHGANGDLLASNDDWQTDAEASQIPAGLQPPNPKESALHRTLSPGNYTGIVRGANNSVGVALVEVYHLP